MKTYLKIIIYSYNISLFMSCNSMNKSDLEKLSKAELIDLLLNKKTKRKPIPTPRKSVKQMVTNYEREYYFTSN